MFKNTQIEVDFSVNETVDVIYKARHLFLQ